MKTEQPVAHPLGEIAEISRVGNHLVGAAHEEQRRRDTAVRLDPPFDPQAETGLAAQKWTPAQTYRFVLISCGLFWSAAALAAWAYLSSH
jgi:hypothetical protein